MLYYIDMSARTDYDKVIAFLVENKAQVTDKSERGLTVTVRAKKKFIDELLDRIQSELALEYPVLSDKEPKKRVF